MGAAHMQARDAAPFSEMQTMRETSHEKLDSYVGCLSEGASAIATYYTRHASRMAAQALSPDAIRLPQVRAVAQLHHWCAGGLVVPGIG